MFRRCDCNDCMRSREIEIELGRLYARHIEGQDVGQLTRRLIEHRILTLENESARLPTCADILYDKWTQH